MLSPSTEERYAETTAGTRDFGRRLVAVELDGDGADDLVVAQSEYDGQNGADQAGQIWFAWGVEL